MPPGDWDGDGASYARVGVVCSEAGCALWEVGQDGCNEKRRRNGRSTVVGVWSLTQSAHAAARDEIGVERVWDSGIDRRADPHTLFR